GLFYVAVVVVMVIAIYFTYQSWVDGGRQQMTFSQMLTKSKDRQLKEIVIKGDQAFVTDSNNAKYTVNLPPIDSTLATTLAQNTNLSSESQSSGGILLQFLPNLILILVIGGFFYY